MNHPKPSRGESAYLKDVIKAYQYAIANLNRTPNEGWDKEEGNYEKARNNMHATIKHECWKATLRHNRSHFHYEEYTTIPDSW